MKKLNINKPSREQLTYWKNRDIELKLSYTIDEKYKISTNKIYSWCHRTFRQKISSYYHELVYFDCLKLKQFDFKVNIDFIFYFKKRALDSSNCSFIAKCIEDWFTKNWLIKDDNINYIWKISMESRKWKENKIEIEFLKY